MSKIYTIGDVQAYIYPNDYKKWLNNLKDYFYEFYIPFLRENYREGDVCVQLGNLFNNKTYITVEVLKDIENIIIEISSILPLYILIGSNDINKNNKDYNLPSLFKHIKNVHIIEEYKNIILDECSIDLIPYIDNRTEYISNIKSGDYLFTNYDSNKIEIDYFKNYKNVFTGNTSMRYENENVIYVGWVYQMKKEDSGNKKGFYTINTSNKEIKLIENNYSPEFKDVSLLLERDIESLDNLINSKDYIDISISNNLLVNNRKLKRKLEVLLEKGKFSSVNYINDTPDTNEVVEVGDISESKEYNINLDYVDFIKEYITDQDYEQEFKDGLLNEYDKIIQSFNVFKNKGLKK